MPANDNKNIRKALVPTAELSIMLVIHAKTLAPNKNDQQQVSKSFSLTILPPPFKIIKCYLTAKNLNNIAYST